MRERERRREKGEGEEEGMMDSRREGTQTTETGRTVAEWARCCGILVKVCYILLHCGIFVE